MNKYALLLAAVAPLASIACGGNARQPDVYRDDTARLITAQANPKIQDCFAGIVKGTPGPKSLEGTTVIHFTVQHDSGLITDASVVPDGTTTQPPVSQCVVASLQGLHLDPADGNDGDATYTWQFQVQ